MRTVGILVTLVCALMAPAGASAQTLDTEQRACAAGCLRLYPGASTPEYTYCAQVKCGIYYEQQSTAPAAPVQRSGWGAGVTADESTHYAGLSNDTRTQSIYYLCDALGASSLSLAGTTAEPGILTVSIDRERYELDFEAKDGALYAYAPIDAAVMVALLRGSQLEIYTTTRELVVAYSLRGAAKAIEQARKGCN